MKAEMGEEDTGGAGAVGAEEDEGGGDNGRAGAGG